MAWLYAALFIIGNVSLIIGVGLLLAVHMKLCSIERMLAEISTRTPRIPHGASINEPAVFRRAHDGEATKVRGMTTEEALAVINRGARTARTRFGRRPPEGL